MKALIRRRGINGYDYEQDTVMLEPWPNADEQGTPYTLEGYRYALCTNAPDQPIGSQFNDARLDAANYDVTEHQETVEQNGQQITRKYWTATWRL